MKITFKPVPFLIQYILLFIPYLNLLLIPIFIWNWILQNHNIKQLFIVTGIIFAVSVYWTIFDIILSVVFMGRMEIFNITDNYLYPYFIPLSIGLVLIFSQKYL